MLILQRYDGDSVFQQRLQERGLGPGSIVQVLRNDRKNPLILKSGETRIAVGREDAMHMQAVIATDAAQGEGRGPSCVSTRPQALSRTPPRMIRRRSHARRARR